MTAWGSAFAAVLAPELGVGGGVTVAKAIEQRWSDPLTVPLIDGRPRTLRSCSDFFAVSHQVSDSLGGRDAQILLLNVVRCQALKAALDGKPAARSYVSDWRIDAAGWRAAPPAFDFEFSPDGEAESQRATALGGSAADLEAVSIKTKDALHAVVRGSGWTGDFAILVRGLDLTGDGVEDLVVSRNVAATEGTLRSMTYFVVTRTSPKGPLKVVKTFP